MAETTTLKPAAMWREPKEDYVVGYMDLIDFECELGAAAGGNRIYASLEDCLKSEKCASGCGVVEVKVEAIKVVRQPTAEEEH